MTQGASSAMLTVLSNSALAPPAVTLSGTGGPPVQTVTALVAPGAAAPQPSASSQALRGPVGHVVYHKATRGRVQCELEFAPGTAIAGKSVRSTYAHHRVRAPHEDARAAGVPGALNTYRVPLRWPEA